MHVIVHLVQGHRSKASIGPTDEIYQQKESRGGLTSVPMAERKHLLPFRTQKLSSQAAIILRMWETSTVPNYIKAILTGWLLSFSVLFLHGIISSSGICQEDQSIDENQARPLRVYRIRSGASIYLYS